MTKARTIALLAASTLASVLAVACGADDAEEAEEEVVEIAEASDERDDEAEPEEPVPTGPPKRIFAKKFVVPVRSAPSRDAERIGFLRAGAVLQATTAEPVGFERCAEGWYELTTGGFVCNGPHVTAFEGRRLPAVRGRQPDRDAPLPYEYGAVRRAKVPMYRRPPTDEEAAQYEGYRIPGAEPEPGEGEAQGGGAEAGAPAVARVQGAEPERGAEGASSMAASSMATEGAAAESATERAATERGATERAATERGEGATMAEAIAMAATSRAGTTLAATAPAPSPAAQQQSDAADDAEDSPTLATLMGDRRSVVARWLLKGFFVSLDRDFRRGSRRYWRTQSNGFVPYAAIVPRTGSTFQGAALAAPAAPAADAEGAVEGASLGEAGAGVLRAPGSPLYAWVLANPPAAYERTERGGFRRARGRVERREGFALTGVQEEERGIVYFESADGRWVRDRDVRVATIPDRPSEVGEDEKWIDVELESQVLVAMVGDRAVYTTLVSSGKADRGEPRPGGSWETPTGLWRIRSKHLTDTMDGDTAVDGPYSVDDVPYVMYFELAYAMHTAFWHDGFGYPRSHGCVNLAPEDARYIFNFADPPLPEGWHSAYPTEAVPGTWIRVRGTTRGRR
ncbi:MAG: L,D-transpeptidase [Myxococcales bacterium]|nr:L,D-transpeptidase [Myxococcales bacterium]